MPTKDSGKPASRKRASAAGKGTESTSQSRGTRKRTASREQPERPPTPTPAAAPTSSAASAESESVARSRAPRRRTSRPLASNPADAAAPAVPLEPVVQPTGARQPRGGATPAATPAVSEPVAEPLAAESVASAEQAAALEETPPAEEEVEIEGAGHEPGGEAGLPLAEELPDEDSPRRRERRGAGTNALGVFIERQFANPASPAHSYSDLERHSGISREALSRYVTARADRRRSPTIDTLVAIADALHVSLEAVARAAGASVRGVIPPPEDVQHAREEALGTLVAALTDEQFNAVVELLRQMRPPIG